jgi:hypothetical protein
MSRIVVFIIAILSLAMLFGCSGISVDGDSDDSTDGDNGDTAGNEVDVTSKWSLWSSNVTLLRGANIWQTVVIPEVHGENYNGPGPVGPPFDQGDLDQLAEMGANYVNISHPGLYTETPPYVLNEDAQDNLDDLLDMIEQADMFAVISFRTGPGRSEFTFVMGEDTVTDPQEGWFDPSYYNDTVWTDQEAQDGWAEMWRYAADRYRDWDIVVGYDLMVEPNAEEVFFDIWAEPTEFYPARADTLYDWNQFYPDLVDAIREVDTETPILVQAMGYGSVVWLPYLETVDDANTVYVFHQYEPVEYAHQVPPLTYSYPGDADSSDEQIDRQWLDDLLSTVDDFQQTHNVPIAVNEFGPMRWEPGADDYMDDLMYLFEQRGFNHAFWEWTTFWEERADNDAFNFRHGPDPDNHTDVDSSDLMNVIEDYWQRNTVRPSTVSFE